jgi:hypothetical protein
MITVQILINGEVIIARSAVNLGNASPPGWCLYEVDDGRVLAHERAAGAVKLAMGLLAGVTEPGLKRREGE